MDKELYYPGDISIPEICPFDSYIPYTHNANDRLDKEKHKITVLHNKLIFRLAQKNITFDSIKLTHLDVLFHKRYALYTTPRAKEIFETQCIFNKISLRTNILFTFHLWSALNDPKNCKDINEIFDFLYTEANIKNTIK